MYNAELMKCYISHMLNILMFTPFEILHLYFSDLFYTRMFPSKMFDVLKDDFDHYLIGGAVLALAVAALITRKLAQKKALKQAWK